MLCLRKIVNSHPTLLTFFERSEGTMRRKSCERDSMNIVDKVTYIYDSKKEIDLNESFISKIDNGVKRIAMVYTKLYGGGVQRVVSLLTQMLNENYDIFILTEEINEKDYFFPSNVKKIKIPGQIDIRDEGSYRCRALALQEIIETHRLDAVCFHGLSSVLLPYDALMFKYNGVATLGVKHEMFSQGMVRRNRIICDQRKYFSLLDRLIVLSRIEMKFWQSLGMNSVYLPNPIGEYAVLADDVEKEFDVIWVGRLDAYQKQYMDVVKIASYIKENGKQISIKMYGGEEKDGDAARLINVIKEKKLDGYLTYCGYLPEDINKAYSSARVQLVTSLYETFPMCIYEGKSNSLPIVTYKMPYLELLSDPGSYIEVEQGDCYGAAQKIIDILSDKKKYNVLSNNSKKSIELYSNESLKEQWIDILNNIYKPYEIDKPQLSYEDLEIMLDAIIFHYGKGVEYDNSVAKTVDNLINFYGKKIIICSYGVKGKKLKTILNNVGIYEEYVLDEARIDGIDNYISYEEIALINSSDYIFLISSRKYAKDIRKKICLYANESTVVDLFLYVDI